METEPDSDTIRRVIERLREPSEPNTEDEEVGAQEERADEEPAQDPDATQG